MSLTTLIADTRKAVADDAANAQAVFAAQGTLVSITEVDVRTGAHTFKVDEPPALGGAGVAANPVQYALASLGSCQAITYRFWAGAVLPGVKRPGNRRGRDRRRRERDSLATSTTPGRPEPLTAWPTAAR